MKKAPRSWLWLQGLACGALACLATPTAVLIAVLLAPGLIVLLIDRDRASSRAMLLCGVAASFASMEDLWSREQSVAASLEILQSPGVLAWAWAAACGGWLLREGAWMGAKFSAELAEGRKVAALKHERARLETEWGQLTAAEPGPPTAGRAA